MTEDGGLRFANPPYGLELSGQLTGLMVNVALSAFAITLR
jgi:hypothetical protein